jgi:hypothetical protein
MLAMGASAAYAATFNGLIQERHYRGQTYTTVGYHNVYIGSSGEYSFDVLSRGVLRGNGVQRNRSGLDSMLRIFTYNGHNRYNLGHQVAVNDDDTTGEGRGDGSRSRLDSYLTAHLTRGWYVATVGDHFFSQHDARRGYNPGGMPGSYGYYRLTVSEVPLPASAAFLLAGLAGLGVMRHKRKKA